MDSERKQQELWQQRAEALNEASDTRRRLNDALERLEQGHDYETLLTELGEAQTALAAAQQDLERAEAQRVELSVLADESQGRLGETQRSAAAATAIDGG